MALSGIDTGEYGAKAIDRLLAVIEANQKATERQTTTMIWLTGVMAALTIITAALAAVTAIPIIIEYWPTVRFWLPW